MDRHVIHPTSSAISSFRVVDCQRVKLNPRIVCPLAHSGDNNPLFVRSQGHGSLVSWTCRDVSSGGTDDNPGHDTDSNKVSEFRDLRQDNRR